jgi:2,3-bisphosphoglycerate-independent phosphoglycerate mutase
VRLPALLAILDGVGIAAPSPTNAVTSADAPFLQGLFGGAVWPCRLLGASGRDVGLPEGQMGNSEVGHLNIGAGRVVDQELTRIDRAIEEGALRGNPALLAAFEAARERGTAVHLMGLLSDGGVHSMDGHLRALLAMAADCGVRRIRVDAFLDGRDVPPASGKAYVERICAFLRGLKEAHPGLDARIGMLAGRYYAMDRDNRWERVERAWRALVVPGASDGAESVAPTASAAPDGAAPFAASASTFPSFGGGPSARETRSVSRADGPTGPWTARSAGVVLPAVDSSAIAPADADPAHLVQASYDAGVTDEFVVPVAIGEDALASGDSVVFFNFRPDRARELTRALIDPAFTGFVRPSVPELAYVCMTEYDPAFERDLGARVAFPKAFPENVLADCLASHGLRQLHIAETEKYAHVTFFFNGGVEEPKPGEQRILVPSPKAATYDLKPQMSAPELTRALVGAIESDAADVYIVNYANGDMVGHTGSLPAAVEAMEAVDRGLKCVIDAIVGAGGVALVTADHGNAEQMADVEGGAWTAHTLSPVPLVLIAPGDDRADLDRSAPARLADVAPTLLDLIGLPVPEEWTGRSLLVRRG